MKKIVLLLFAMVLILSGCLLTVPGKEAVTFEKLQSSNNGQSILYVYRPFHIMKGSVMFNVLVDGDVRGTISKNEYIPLVLIPGTHQITLESSATWPKNTYGDFSIDIKPGEMMFYRWTPDMIKQAKMVKVSAATAEEEMQGMIYRKPVEE
nr:DUF2846 domain-containing protein [uncultured Desulfobacter sp.]